MGVRRRADDRRLGVLSATQSEQAQQPLTIRKDLTKAEASKLIDEMRKKAGVEQELQEEINICQRRS
ncbi:DUF3072 domain-containing protein [Bradyrhizobium sp. URHD0069]|uniref:DUF3072 domain-containing protein n=1 Tax=Bradyrhizobium sp. URHD0069 TaxID=1380355 RepID=UPI0004962CAC